MLSVTFQVVPLIRFAVKIPYKFIDGNEEILPSIRLSNKSNRLRVHL
jgi:hypothetical protein